MAVCKWGICDGGVGDGGGLVVGEATEKFSYPDRQKTKKKVKQNLKGLFQTEKKSLYSIQFFVYY